MHRRSTINACFSIALWIILAPVGSLRAEPDVHDTRLLSLPAASARHVAFVYADDLWLASLDGGNVRRLTSDGGVASAPFFSPDGTLIAFSAQYDGNTDVYTIPVSGGAPRRLTFHPAADVVRGFTPDGKAVLFSSPRNVFTGRYTQLFTVPLGGGMPEQLPIPNGVQAAFSPDGNRIAYTPLGDRSQQWKHYRGGTCARILIFDRRDYRVEQIAQPEGHCNDLDPHWIGDTVYFRSDRNGEYNLFAWNTKTRAIKQLTTHADFPIVEVGAGGGRLIYEQAGYLHLFDPAWGASTRLKIGVATDLVETRPRFVRGAKYIRNAAISPSGARAVFEFRGEIVTVPAEKGDPRNVTESPAVHDRSPAWSPDGRWLAWFSDEGGEYRLHVGAADGKGKKKIYDPRGAGFYQLPTWSPDGKKIAFIDNSQSLSWIELEHGEVQKIAAEPLYQPGHGKTLRPAWSPDSKWIVYALSNRAAYHRVFAYELATRQARPITDGLSDALDPVFDAGGKYLYFLASTDAGPVNQWFAQSSADMRVCRSIYLTVLKRGVPSPLARESDEERPGAASAEGSQDVKPRGKSGDAKDKDGDAKGKDGDAKADAASKPSPVQIDFDGIDQRIIALPEPEGDYRNLNAGLAGQIFYEEWPASRRETASSSEENASHGATLRRFDLTKRKSELLLPGVGDYALATGGKKALIYSPPESWSIVDVAGNTVAPGKGKLKVDAIEVRIDPPAEWQQIFDEAWRINRDYFYDPGMHGADWPAIRRKYAAFLPHLATRGDLDRVIRWMLSELSVGHSFLGPGERLHARKIVPGGLLGADYEAANGRYRFKKVYGGLNWSPDLRAPLTAPGVDVKAGEYLLAVRGIELRSPTEIYSLFENTAGKSIEISVGPKPDGSGRRTVTVEPLANEYAIRNRDWIEGNLKKVQAATGGRVAYVYVPDTARSGHASFKRYFYPQCDKQAIIIDERFNSGGQVADYYIDHLRRPFSAMWATRYGEDQKTPGAAIQGPKVMLIDETAGSGGDMLPWMFRKFHIGPLVGKRTWGGLVGMLGFPVLMDGGSVTAPNLAIWTEEGWVVENQGVSPDVEVEQSPSAVIAGHDPQLEKAIQIVLQQLKEHPPEPLTRPAYPVRAAGLRDVRPLLANEIVGPVLPLAEVQRYCESRVAPMPAVKTAAAWEAEAMRLRTAVLDKIVFRGAAARWRNAKTKVEWLDTIPSGPGYRIKKLRFEALPGMWIPALLYEPQELAGKVPAILNVNGHNRPLGKSGASQQVRCVNQARRGMIALNIEWLGMGQLNSDGFDHSRMNQLDLVGASGLAPFYLSLQRSLDILLHLEHADPERVAVTGLSGGGWQTIFFSALEPRVKLANPVAGYSSYHTRILHAKDLGDSEQTPNDLATLVDYTHLTAMMAPRPTLLTYNAKDNCCFESGYAMLPLEDAATPIFRLFGKADRLRTHVNQVPGTHNFERDNREALYRMLGDFFYPGDAKFDAREIPSDNEVKQPGELAVAMPPHNEDFQSLALALCQHLPNEPKLPNDKDAALKWQQSRREKLRGLVRADHYAVTAAKRDSREQSGVKATSWQLQMGGAWTVPAVELVDGQPKKTALLLADSGRAGAAQSAARLLADGYRVLAIDPFGLGESKIEKNDWLFALLVASVGQRPLGIQASQVAVAARWLAAQAKNGPVTLVAVGPRSSTIALVATALEPKAIGALQLHGALGSLKEVIEQNWSVNTMPEMFCFGLLESFDVLQLAALAAPRPVQFFDASPRAKSELGGLRAWYRTLSADCDPLP